MCRQFASAVDFKGPERRKIGERVHNESRSLKRLRGQNRRSLNIARNLFDHRWVQLMSGRYEINRAFNIATLRKIIANVRGNGCAGHLGHLIRGARGTQQVEQAYIHGLLALADS